MFEYFGNFCDDEVIQALKMWFSALNQQFSAKCHLDFGHQWRVHGNSCVFQHWQEVRFYPVDCELDIYTNCNKSMNCG